MTASKPCTEFDDLALKAALKTRAIELGFELCGVAAAVQPPGWHPLLEWIQQGHAGRMEYIERRLPAYQHPDHVLAGTRSVVMLGMNYRTKDPADTSAGQGRFSRYSWGGTDYHDLIRKRLRSLADVIHQDRPGCRTRGVVDTAPLLERDFARLSGLGWIGKNTLLINKHQGSWLFLAGLLTDVWLPPDDPHEASHCGTCTRCLEACPTDAFPTPHVLDARRCISYLTIELRDEAVPVELRPGLGDWLFGCDICQDVCPWNRKAPVRTDGEFVPRASNDPVDLVTLLDCSPEEFRTRFDGTPLERTGRGPLLRNACYVLANQRDQRAVPALIRSLEDPDPLIRGAAAYALGQLSPDAGPAALHSRRQIEQNASVLSEIADALNASL